MSANTEMSLFKNGSHSHPNPMFDFLSGYVPRKLKDLFRWTEYLYYNSPHIFQALVKLSDYILTDVVIKTDSDTDRKRYSDLFKKLKLLPELRACARDRMIYGNSFVSIYFPFVRWTTCPDCSTSMKLKHCDYTFSLKEMRCHLTCRSCGHNYSADIQDLRVEKDNDRSKINIIRWDPKLMDVDYNPITGHSTYYYTLPEQIKEQIEEGNLEMVETTPNEFLECLSKEDQIFRFAADQIYHMKVPAPAGIDPSWGYPPITSVIKQFFYAQVLRKANEAIALDYLVPLRVIHPAQVSGSGDPFTSMSMEIWVEESKQNFKQWRRDPLHMMFAPVAMGVTQVGGTGRTLLTLGEVESVENNILAGMGLPREFLYGGLSYTGSSVTLRMIENQLRTHSADIDDLMSWIKDRIRRETDWGNVEVEFTSFRFLDDVHQKNMILQLSQMYGFISKRTLAEIFDVNYDDEIKQVAQEQIDDARRAQEQEQKVNELQNTLSQQASAQANAGAGMNYDQHAILAQADSIAQQLMGMDEGTKKSQLHGLQSTDAVMYAVVVQRLEQYQTETEAQARAQSRGMV